ncbi:MAG: ABC transporter permease [Muribaculaceae bacterium]|nr:ABC transporter permease [Muribaculaceae bacterium]
MKRFPLSAGIAWRYLHSKKSHSAVGAISAVSICGIAVATAAIICVLSVFNGFKSVIAERIDTLTPDVMVAPASGKVFANGDSVADILKNMPEVERATPTILENALAIYEGRETPVSIKGVDLKEYPELTALNSLIIDSLPAEEAEREATLINDGSRDDEDDIFVSDHRAILSVGAAARLTANPGSRILLFTPRREGRVNLANPTASFLRDSILTVGVYRSNQSDFDDNRIVVDINLARDLLQYDLESSAVEVKARPGITSEDLAKTINRKLNVDAKTPRFIVKDRLRQQEMNFRMISIEKWVTFLLLFFILVIASFNIISSLSMLVIEKDRSMATMRAIGMSRGRISSVFRWESIFVTSVGGFAGIIIGLILCILQQHYGFITLQGDPGTLVVRSYPVMVDPIDILITLIPLIMVGAAAALITGAFARSRC